MRVTPRSSRSVNTVAAKVVVAALSIVASCSQAAVESAPGVSVSAPETGAFIVRLGTDTVAVERYTRTATRLEGDIALRSPARIGHYVVSLGADGRPTTAEYTVRRPDGSMIPNAPRSTRLTFGPDSAVSVIETDSAITRRVAARAGWPSLPTSFALSELALRHLVASGRDSADVTMLAFGGANASVFPMRLYRPDSARITWFGGSPQHVRLDRGGRIIAVDATPTTFKVRVTVSPTSMYRRLPARLQPPKPVGVAS